MYVCMYVFSEVTRFFVGCGSLLSSNQQFQSTEGNMEHTHQPVAWLYILFFFLQIFVVRNAASFIMALLRLSGKMSSHNCCSAATTVHIIQGDSKILKTPKPSYMIISMPFCTGCLLIAFPSRWWINRHVKHNRTLKLLKIMQIVWNILKVSAVKCFGPSWFS